MINQLRNAIKEKLDTLESAATVKDIFDLNIEGYPAVMFEPVEVNNAINDTCNNLREYRFAISVVQEFERIDRAQAMQIVTGLYEDISDLFDKDRTLGGLCSGGLEPATAKFGVYTMEGGRVLFIDFTINCKVLTNIY